MITLMKLIWSEERRRCHSHLLALSRISIEMAAAARADLFLISAVPLHVRWTKSCFFETDSWFCVPISHDSMQSPTQPFHVLRNDSELTVWRIAGARLRNIDLSYHSGEIG
jgi:hypothetical protein